MPFEVGHALGVQVYQCNGTAWTFVEPKAVLVTNRLAVHPPLRRPDLAAPGRQLDPGHARQAGHRRPKSIPWLLLLGQEPDRRQVRQPPDADDVHPARQHARRHRPGGVDLHRRHAPAPRRRSRTPRTTSSGARPSERSGGVPRLQLSTASTASPGSGQAARSSRSERLARERAPQRADLAREPPERAPRVRAPRRSGEAAARVATGRAQACSASIACARRTSRSGGAICSSASERAREAVRRGRRVAAGEHVAERGERIGDAAAQDVGRPHRQHEPRDRDPDRRAEQDAHEPLAQHAAAADAEVAVQEREHGGDPRRPVRVAERPQQHRDAEHGEDRRDRHRRARGDPAGEQRRRRRPGRARRRAAGRSCAARPRGRGCRCRR